MTGIAEFIIGPLRPDPFAPPMLRAVKQGHAARKSRRWVKTATALTLVAV